MHSLQDVIQYLNELEGAITQVSSAGGKSSYLINTNIVQTFLAKLTNSRYSLVTAIPAVKTSTFQTSDYGDWYKGFEEDFRDVDTMLANLENAFRPILTGDLSDLSVATKRLHDNHMKFEEAIQVLERRMSFNLQRMQTIDKRLDLLKSRKEFGETALAVRTLSLLILIGLTGFCAVLTYKLRKPKPPPSPMTQAQRGISRTQRQKYQAMRDARRTTKQ